LSSYYSVTIPDVQANSAMRECLVGHLGKPTLTGDWGFRLLLRTRDMVEDPELVEFATDLQVNH